MEPLSLSDQPVLGWAATADVVELSITGRVATAADSESSMVLRLGAVISLAVYPWIRMALGGLWTPRRAGLQNVNRLLRRARAGGVRMSRSRPGRRMLVAARRTGRRRPGATPWRSERER